MADICVTRQIFCRRKGNWEEGVISVFMPEIHIDPAFTNETWKCRFKIEWPDFTCDNVHYGSHGYQALELALRTVPSMIMATDDFKSRNLSLFRGEVILDSTSIREFFHARILGDV